MEKVAGLKHGATSREDTPRELIGHQIGQNSGVTAQLGFTREEGHGAGEEQQSGRREGLWEDTGVDH